MDPLDPFDVTEGSPVPATSCITYGFYNSDMTKLSNVPSYLSLTYPDIILTSTTAGTLTVKQEIKYYTISA